MRRRLLLLSWLFHRDCCAVAIHPDHALGKGYFVVISECFTEFFTACYTFLLLLCREVGGGRKTASKMSATPLYEQARATLRTKQRGTDGRVKEHKRQRKQVPSLSLTHSLSLSLSLSLFLSLSMLLSPYFFCLDSPPFFMTNTLILHVSCVYFLSSFSLFFVSSYDLGTYIGHPTAQRSHVDCNQRHSRKMPASSDSTHDCLFAVLAWGGGGGGLHRSRLEPTYQPRIFGRVTYS